MGGKYGLKIIQRVRDQYLNLHYQLLGKINYYKSIEAKCKGK
jgi:hypothetical protein